MHNIYYQKKDQFLKIVHNYADRWLKNTGIKFIEKMNRVNTKSDELIWNNPENLESGLSGVTIFFIDAYKRTKNEQFLQLAQQMISELIIYCKNNPTNNFALYTGRCGVTYAILQMYQLTKDTYLLGEAVDITKAASLTFLNSEYVDDSLYQGRAGTLLAFFNLYEITGDSFLLGQIHLFVDKIINNMSLSESGVYWEKKEEVNLRPLVGFARGTSGIRYVFNRIKEILPTETVEYLNCKLKQYEDSCWIDEFNNWGNFSKNIKCKSILEICSLADQDISYYYQPNNDNSWAEGTAGLGFSRFFSDNDINTAASVLYDNLANCEIKDMTLFNGLAGVGCFFLVASQQSKVKYQQIALTIGDKILSHLLQKRQFTDGLKNGDTGLMLFLLYLIEPNASRECILMPLSTFLSNTSLKITKQHLSISEIRRRILTKHFNRTFAIIKQVNPKIYEEFFKRIKTKPGKTELEIMITYIDTFIDSVNEAPIGPPLKDVFTIEKKKYAFTKSEKRSKTEVYVEEFIRHGKIIEHLNNFDDRLLDTMIIRSNKVEVFSTNWNWQDTDASFNKTEVINKLFKKPRRFETMLRMDENSEIIESVLQNTELLCWHWFKSYSTIRLLLEDITFYYKNLNSIQVEEKIKFYDLNDRTELHTKLHDVHLSKIKEWLYEGILILQF